MSVSWVADQILMLAEKSGPTNRFNPRPPGRTCEGSAAHAIEELLARNPNRWWSPADILAATGRSRTAVGWALYYLRQIRRIDARPDPAHSRYYLYRFPEEGQ